VVARVAGKSFPEFCQERIFGPLGMSRTHFHDDHRRIVSDRAYSYEKSGDQYQASPLNYANVGATSLFTTAPDLVRWLDNFREPKVGGRAAIERLQEQAVLADGKKIDYALGLAVGRHRGLKTVSHGGGDAGYRSFVLWFPEQELGVAVVSGLASFDSAATAHKVAEVFLEDEMTPNPPKRLLSEASDPGRRQYITLASSVLDQLIGHYRLDAGVDADIRQKDGKLIADVPGQGSQELRPLATNRFYIEAVNGELEFVLTNSPLRLKFTHDGNTVTGERTALAAWEPTGLEQFQGVYWSDELETQYTIVLRNGKLMAQHVRHGNIALLPVGPERVTSSEWFMPELIFMRDTSNRVTGFTAGGGRVAGIRFTRKSSL